MAFTTEKGIEVLTPLTPFRATFEILHSSIKVSFSKYRAMARSAEAGRAARRRVRRESAVRSGRVRLGEEGMRALVRWGVQVPVVHDRGSIA